LRHASACAQKNRQLAIAWRWCALVAALVASSGCASDNDPSVSAAPKTELTDAGPAASSTTTTEPPDASTITPESSTGPTDAEIFDDSVLHEFIVEISQAEWEGISQDMLDYAEKFPVVPFYDGDGREYRSDKYRKADFIYRRRDGAEVKLSQVGIRTRGNESRRVPYQNGRYLKSHFKVKFDETFDMPDDDPAVAAVSKRRFAGLKALNFKWSRYNTWDTYANRSKINELFSYLLLSKVGVNAPRMSMATLKFRIAGKDVNYGLYGIVEPVDKPFLKRQFGSSDGDLYKCLFLNVGPDLTEESLSGDNVGVKDPDTNYRPDYDLQTNETTSNHSALRGFVRQLNALVGQQFVDYMDANFDVESFIRYLAIGIYINNLDDYRFMANNYYLFFNSTGKVEFVPYDFDISLGTNWHGELAYSEFIDEDIFNTRVIHWAENLHHPLVDKVLAVDKYRTRYVQYLKDYILPENRLFLFSQYKAKFDQLFAIYGTKTSNDTVDPDPMGLAGYEQKYFFDKTKNVLDQLQVPYAGYEVQ
jgi:spore coat protein CotH